MAGLGLPACDAAWSMWLVRPAVLKIDARTGFWNARAGMHSTHYFSAILYKSPAAGGYSHRKDDLAMIWR